MDLKSGIWGPLGVSDLFNFVTVVEITVHSQPLKAPKICLKLNVVDIKFNDYFNWWWKVQGV